MSPQTKGKLREDVAAATCPGCRAGWELDSEYDKPTHIHRYQQEAFGRVWSSTSWIKCERDYKVADAILNVLARFFTNPENYV